MSCKETCCKETVLHPGGCSDRDGSPGCQGRKVILPHKMKGTRAQEVEGTPPCTGSVEGKYNWRITHLCCVRFPALEGM